MDDLQLNEHETNPEELLKMFAAVELGNSVDAESADPVVAPVVEPIADGNKAAPAAATITEQEAAGIATRDGKHVIPYSVLASERARATQAEQNLQAMTERLAQLEAAGQSGNSVTDGFAPTDQADAVSDEDLAVMKEDFPTQYKHLMAMQAKIDALTAQVKPVVESAQLSEEAQQLAIETEVQTAIDATPKLAHLLATDPSLTAMAKQFDNALRSNPAWSDKPLSARFAKVVELVEQSHGAITIPGQSAAPNTVPAKTAAQVRAEAQALAAQGAQATRTNVPTSLSEFSAGDAPGASEQDKLASMTPAQMAQHLGAMSPDKLDAYLKNPYG